MFCWPCIIVQFNNTYSTNLMRFRINFTLLKLKPSTCFGHHLPILRRHYTTLHYTTYITPHHTTPHYTTLHYTTLHYTTLHYTTLHYTTLHYTTLHYTTLRYTTLHYITSLKTVICLLLFS
jgi:hypothetical protein